MKKKEKKYLSSGPSITKLEKKIVNEMMNYGWDNYKYVEKFEANFAKFHNRKYCLMTPSCTLAIYLSLKVLNIKEGDEVIVPDVTWTASVSPIVEVGATPIFVDIDENNWCIDQEKILNKISKKTKAILCVNLFGNFTNILKLKIFCKKKNIILLEDAAEALGSEYNGVKAGKFGDISFHSFHRTKTITSGEGGALLTDSYKIYKLAKHLRDLGRSTKNSYIAESQSLKYMPSNLQASILCAQLQRIKNLLKIKRNIYEQYKKNFSKISVSFNIDNKIIKNGFWAIVVKFENTKKLNVFKLINYLKKYNIFAREFFRPLTSQKAYKKYKEKKIKLNNSVSYKLFKTTMVLPSHYNLSNNDVNFISNKILNYIKSRG